jgi:hypothetical protein
LSNFGNKNIKKGMNFLTFIFNNDATPWVIAAILIIFTLVTARRWLFHVIHLQNQIKIIKNVIGLPNILSIPEDYERWQAFVSDYYEESKLSLAKISKDNPVARQTLEFLKHCEVVDTEDFGLRRLETSASPAQIIRLTDYLHESKIYVAFFKAFPNYLVGIGLCITFLGLAVVIGNASHVLDPNSAVDSSLALRDLLVAASSKFWSSLTAVALSIVYGIWFRGQAQHLEWEFAHLARDLENCVRVLSSEIIQYESLQRLRRCEEYQEVTATGIGMLKIAIDEQGINIGKGIGEGIANGAGAELSKEIEKSLKLLRDVADEFNTLTNEVKEQSGTIRDNFNEAQISSAQISSSFQEIPSQSNQLKEAASTLKDAATHAATSISQIIQENAKIASRWQEIGSLVQRIDQSLAQEVEKTTEIFPKFAENLNSFSDVLQKSMTQSLVGLSANIKDLAKSHEEHKIQSSIWRESAVAVASSAETVSSHLNRLVNLVESQKIANEQFASLTGAEKMNSDSDLRDTTSPE